MFKHWRKPPIFEDAANFLESCNIPYYIVSNTDTDDVIVEIHYHGLTPIKIFTSEEAKSYKPRTELFEMALKETNLGINTIWMNRNNKKGFHI